MASAEKLSIASEKRRLYIGICGRLGSGKSTAAGFVAKLLGADDWVVVAFAAAIKSFVAKLAGIDVKLLYTDEGKAAPCKCPAIYSLMEAMGSEVLASVDQPCSYGVVLQEIGLLFRQTFHEGIWISSCLDSKAAAKFNLIVEDVRYENELDEIHKRGGKVIKLVRSSTSAQSIAGRNMNHPSETTADKLNCDVVINNDGTREELYVALLTALKTFKYF